MILVIPTVTLSNFGFQKFAGRAVWCWTKARISLTLFRCWILFFTPSLPIRNRTLKISTDLLLTRIRTFSLLGQYMNWVRPVKLWLNIVSCGAVAVSDQDLDQFTMPGILSCVGMSRSSCGYYYICTMITFHTSDFNWYFKSLIWWSQHWPQSIA